MLQDHELIFWYLFFCIFLIVFNELAVLLKKKLEKVRGEREIRSKGEVG